MKTQFLNYILAGYPLLWVNTHEEWRVLTSYTRDLTTKPKHPYQVYTWDAVDGVRPVTIKDNVLATGDPIMFFDKPLVDPLSALQWLEGVEGPNGYEGATDNTVLFLKDYHEHLRENAQSRPVVSRKLRNIIPKLKAVGKAAVIISPVITLPVEIEKDMKVIKFQLPTREDLKHVLKATAESGGTAYPKDDDQLIDAALGMSEFEAENAYAISLVEAKKFDPAIIRKEKAAIVEKTGLLEVIETSETLDDIGGLEKLKEWLLDRASSFSQDAKEYGVDAPKGALFVGVPGGGKSLTAKAIASAWGRPLLRMDVGRLFNSLQGETEANVRRGLAISEAIAPCVLWIDELEKSFSGTQSSDSDGHGTTKRVFQAFLTWMQEKTADVFIVATANDVKTLPGALLRAGRIDVTFWVDVPGAQQRLDILKIHLRKKKRTLESIPDFDVVAFHEATKGFTGAEIEQAVKNSLTLAFSRQHKDIMMQDLIDAANTVTPVVKLGRDEVEESRKWALDRGAYLASINEKDDIPTTVNGKRRIATS